jgi:hypothetical protein
LGHPIVAGFWGMRPVPEFERITKDEGERESGIKDCLKKDLCFLFYF